MNRRIKRLNVCATQIILLFSEPKFVMDRDLICFNHYRIKGLPTDAEVVGATYDIAYNAISLFIHSESFEEIPQYSPIPIIEMEVEILKEKGRYRRDEPYRPLL